ncbi:hypothetical protein Tco_1546627 [Tanacetum coccineum]
MGTIAKFKEIAMLESLTDKSSDSETYASCDSSLKTKTKDFPPTVDIKTLPESDVEDPNSTAGSPSFSCLENVKSPRIFCNKSGMNNRNVCKNNSVRVKKCFVCGSKLHLIKDCDFYNCVDYVPCKSKAASVPAGSRNSPASVTAGGSDPAASRNRPAVNSVDRPNPAGLTQLHFDDANGIFNMPNSDILEGMRVIGYPTDQALTFFKHHLSPQWRFLGDLVTVNDIGSTKINGLSDSRRDYAEALSKLQRQEYEARTQLHDMGSCWHLMLLMVISAGSAVLTCVVILHGGKTLLVVLNSAVSYEHCWSGNPAVSTSVSADFIPVHADESTLPPGQSLGSSENTKRFPVPSECGQDNISSGIFTSYLLR